MDIYSLLWLVIFLYFAICIGIICLSDSDILTFIYSKAGKDLDEAFNEKVVWITGASSGIGEGIGKELSKIKGSKIILSARRKDELERVKSECLANNPGKDEDSIFVLPLDMTDYSSHEPALKKVLEIFGKLDILISNAGRSQRAKWHEIDIEVDKGLFDLNVFSLINLNRIVVRHFFEVGSGHLAVMSSIGGKFAGPIGSTYVGSKHALHGYFEGLRNETVKRNLDITLICPGPVESALVKEAFASEIGKKVEGAADYTSRKMSAARCGHLSLISIANKLEETWLAPFPVLPFTYLSAYQPFIFSKLQKIVNSRNSS